MLYPLSDFLLQQTFHYNAALWNNKETFNLDGGKTGFDSQETKLPSYWNVLFQDLPRHEDRSAVKFHCNQQERQFPVLFDC